MKSVLMGLLMFSFALPSLRAAEAPLSFEQAIASASTPKELAALMKKNFRFTKDEKNFHETDHWQSPKEIWDRKTGDCEDYALFAQYVLRTHGIDAETVSIYGAGGYAHTIVIFKEAGFFRILNQAKLERFHAKSMPEAISLLNPEWTWAAIAKLKASRGYIRETFSNSRIEQPQPSVSPHPFPL